MMRIKMPTLASSERLLAYSNALYIVAAVLALIATFAIVYLGSRVAKLKDIELSVFREEAQARIAVANATAATARKNAEQAKADSAQAHATSLTARADAENAKAQAAVANAEAVRLRVEALQLQVRATEAERVNREQIFRIRIAENNSKPRELNSEQSTQIALSLKQFSGMPLTLWILSTDIEPIEYAEKLSKAFNAAGIVCTPQYLSGVAGRGLTLVLHSLDDYPPMARTITETLQRQNISLTPFADPSRVPVHGFAIGIGIKAPFFPDDRLGEAN